MTGTAVPGRSAPRARRRLVPRLRRGEWLVLLALTGIALGPLLGLLARVWVKGGLVTGADGYLVVDQLQYLNWIRQASETVLIGNRYDLADGPRTFLHPLLAASGLLHALGLGLVASYMVWKVAAVGALFAGARAYVRRHLDHEDDRLLALAVALLAVSPVAALVGWTGLGGPYTKIDLDFLTGELWTGTYLWGYLFTAIAVGLLPVALLAYERGREGGGRRPLLWAGAAGLMVSWLQPWQGATLLLVLGGAELVAWRRGSRAGGLAGVVRDAALPVALTVLPLAYYLVLSLTDPSWELAGTANDLPRWPWWVTVVGLAPFALPALLALRLPAPDFGAVALRVWPLAGLVVFRQPAGTFPFHAFQGLLLPLAVLAALALRARLGDRRLAGRALAAVGAAIVLLIVPGTLYRADELRDAVNRGYQPHFLRTEEHDALRWLDRHRAEGGVLAPVYSGLLIPAYTGRETWVGAGSWTPDFPERRVAAEQLFDGALSRAQAEALVRASGARFLFADCHDRARIDDLVAGVTRPPVRFGCATVFEVAR